MFLYLLPLENQSKFKIGITITLPNRILQIQSDYGKLNLASSVFVESEPANIRRLEKTLHFIFSASRVVIEAPLTGHTEWFKQAVFQTVLGQIKQIANNQPNIPYKITTGFSFPITTPKPNRLTLEERCRRRKIDLRHEMKENGRSIFQLQMLTKKYAKYLIFRQSTFSMFQKFTLLFIVPKEVYENDNKSNILDFVSCRFLQRSVGSLSFFSEGRAYIPNRSGTNGADVNICFDVWLNCAAEMLTEKPYRATGAAQLKIFNRLVKTEFTADQVIAAYSNNETLIIDDENEPITGHYAKYTTRELLEIMEKRHTYLEEFFEMKWPYIPL